MEHPKDGSEPRYFRFRQVKENGAFVPAKYPEVLASPRRSRRSKTTVRRPIKKSAGGAASSESSNEEAHEPTNSKSRPKSQGRKTSVKKLADKGKGKAKALPSRRKRNQDSDGLSIDDIDADEEETEEEIEEQWRALDDEDSTEDDELSGEGDVPLRSAFRSRALRRTQPNDPQRSEDMENDDEDAVATALELGDALPLTDPSSPGAAGVSDPACGPLMSGEGLPIGCLSGPASAGATEESRLHFLEGLNGRVEFVSMLHRAAGQVSFAPNSPCLFLVVTWNCSSSTSLRMSCLQSFQHQTMSSEDGRGGRTFLAIFLVTSIRMLQGGTRLSFGLRWDLPRRQPPLTSKRIALQWVWHCAILVSLWSLSLTARFPATSHRTFRRLFMLVTRL